MTTTAMSLKSPHSINGELRDWYRIQQGTHLLFAGKMFGHPLIKDGKWTITSVVTSEIDYPNDKVLIRTQSGFRYMCFYDQHHKENEDVGF